MTTTTTTTTEESGQGSDLAGEVRDWIERNWDPQLTVGEWWRRLADAGLAYSMWPSGVGGRGLSAGAARTVTEQLAAARVIAPPVGHVAATLAAPTILDHGTAEQINRFVPPIACGQASWCQLFSEPGSGSDLASVGTRAVRDGDEWIVTGQKVWNSGADSAQMGMLLARTDLDAPKHRGMTYFLIDMDQPGIEVRPLRQMNGMSSFCEVFISEARVGHDCILGELNGGWRIAQTTLAHERGSVSGRGATGLAQARSGTISGDVSLAASEIIARSARARTGGIAGGAVPTKMMLELARQFERAADPVTRQELARYYTQNKVNSWTMRRVAAAKGRLTGADGSMSKLATSRICQQSRDLAFSILGAATMLDGSDAPMRGDLQRVGLGSPGTRIGGGTDEVQLNVLGERGLGLPREPSDDADTPYRELRVGTQR
ncbi:MAG: putative acyl-CoA dehydrogenase [Acidimicrobiales bacterium]|nr:putative acyl-CoA dehydrogenase [Acidimicrobiales bacterium]